LIVQVTLASSTRLWNVVTWYTYMYIHSYTHPHRHINIFLSINQTYQVLVKPIMVPKTKQNQLTNLNFNFLKHISTIFFIMLFKAIKTPWNAKKKTCNFLNTLKYERWYICQMNVVVIDLPLLNGKRR
jgi:hypothetical protein